MLAYFMMLCAMTYSVEVFASVLIGASVGHLLFHDVKKPPKAVVDKCCEEYEDSSDSDDEQGTNPLHGIYTCMYIYIYVYILSDLSSRCRSWITYIYA